MKPTKDQMRFIRATRQYAIAFSAVPTSELRAVPLDTDEPDTSLTVRIPRRNKWAARFTYGGDKHQVVTWCEDARDRKGGCPMSLDDFIERVKMEVAYA